MIDAMSYPNVITVYISIEIRLSAFVTACRVNIFSVIIDILSNIVSQFKGSRQSYIYSRKK